MTLIELREHVDSTPVELTVEQRDALTAAVPAMSVRAEPGSSDRYILNPRDAVGALKVGGLQVVIAPKIQIARLLFLVAYSIDPKRWRESPFDFEEDVGVVEAIAAAFALQIERALRSGLVQGYVSRDEALQTVRGRIRFNDQLRDRLGIVPPIECSHDDFTIDVELNRILLAGTDALLRLPLRDEAVARRLRRIATTFADVTYVNYDPRAVPALRYDRLNAQFRPAAELARLVLQGRSFELGVGSAAGASFLLNMAWVFEMFVLVALREALQLDAKMFPAQSQGRPLWLDERDDGVRRLRLRPDLSWWKGDDCVFVGDAKYKRTAATGKVLHPDIYQLLAYATATDLPRALLIYASGEVDPDPAYAVRHAEKVLEVRTLDLDRAPDELLAQVGAIASAIQAMAKDAPVPLTA